MKKLFVACIMIGMVLGFAFAGGAQEESEAEGAYKVGFITFYRDFFMQTVLAGVEIAADELGVEVSSAISELDEAKEAKIIDDMIVKGVDAIIISPVSSDGSTAAVKRAKDAGITIIFTNTKVNEPGIGSSFIYTPGEEHGAATGRAVAEFVKNELGGKAKMAMLNCDMYELCVQRKNGFFAELDGLDIEVATNQQGWVADEAVTVAESVLQAHPDVDFLWAENEGGTVGLVQAVKTLGVDIPVFGLDMSTQIAQMLLSDDNILQATTGQSPMDIGYLSMYAAYDVLEGKSVEDVIYSPVIYFDRNDPEKIQEFIDKDGQIFATK
jgi:ABC-type sugar transport system substrate-binding protein